MKNIKVEVYARYSGKSTFLICHEKSDGNLWATRRALKSACDRVCLAGIDYLRLRQNSVDGHDVHIDAYDDHNHLIAVVA